MQFAIVLLKNLVLFPAEQPHFIMTFFVEANAPFSTFKASTFAPGELCVCVFVLGYFSLD